jgi:hypothetical protein
VKEQRQAGKTNIISGLDLTKHDVKSIIVNKILIPENFNQEAQPQRMFQYVDGSNKYLSDVFTFSL